jgi:hypothetical protein
LKWIGTAGAGELIGDEGRGSSIWKNLYAMAELELRPAADFSGG